MILLAVASFLLAAEPAPSPQPSPVVVAVAGLRPTAGSHVSGEARLTAAGAKLDVTITLDGVFIPEMQYPASIRTGGCTNAAAPLTVALRAVQEGSSRTTVASPTVAELLRTPHSLRIMDAGGTRMLWCGEIVMPGTKRPG